MGTGKLNAGGNPVMDLHPIQGEVEILLVASCYRNQDKPLGSYADFNLPTFTILSFNCLVLNSFPRLKNLMVVMLRFSHREIISIDKFPQEVSCREIRTSFQLLFFWQHLIVNEIRLHENWWA